MIGQGCPVNGPVAQTVERGVSKPEVVGSIPTRSSNISYACPCGHRGETTQVGVDKLIHCGRCGLRLEKVMT